MMNSASWMLRIVIVAIVALGFIGNAIAQSPRTNLPAPVMTDELMARLIKFTRGVPETGGVSAKICLFFKLCDGTMVMPLKMAESEMATDGEHVFALPLDTDSKDILFLVKRNGIIQAFLTDKSRVLRAAAMLEKTGDARPITKEQADAQFKAELELFAKEAAGLPPTGSAPGNN